MKNVYAIAMGIFDGCFGVTGPSNEKDTRKTARHSLLNICMLEFIQFGLKHGARLSTLLGPSGIGDIQASSTEQSRNYRHGDWRARRDVLGAQDRQPEELHEGYDTVRSAMELADGYGIETPILRATYNILFQRKKVQDEIPGLLDSLAHYVDETQENEFDELRNNRTLTSS